MRITILTAGSLGDIQPYVALGLGLKEAGHEIRLAANAPFQEFVESRGLEFYPIRGDLGELMETKEGRQWKETGANFLLFIQALRKLIFKAQSFLEKNMDDSFIACRGAGAIIASPAGIGCPHIAQKMEIPCYWALLQPMMNRTRSMPHFLSPPGLRLGRSYNSITHRISEIVYWKVFGKSVNKWRKEKLNLPPLSRKVFFKWIQGGEQPFLYCFSPNMIQKPTDWGDWIHLTGYWYLEKESPWKPPTDLVKFLESGSPPVYFNLGSIKSRNPQRLLEWVLNALAQTGQRGLLQFDGDLPKTSDLPGSVFRIGSVPHDWLFPQMAAVVHHGGSGTTSTVLRAGVPSFVIYAYWDHPYFGRRSFELGVGPKPIFFKKLTQKKLTKAIITITSDSEMQARAFALGQRMRTENGVTRAVEAFHRHLR
jgi:UDP:flavonoid glycosyltransferase YjiC (YdhE family)